MREKARQIAVELHLSEATVKEYLSRIVQKVGVRTELGIHTLLHRAQYELQRRSV